MLKYSDEADAVWTGTYGLNMYNLDISTPFRRFQTIRYRTRVRPRGPARLYRVAAAVAKGGDAAAERALAAIRLGVPVIHSYGFVHSLALLSPLCCGGCHTVWV